MGIRLSTSETFSTPVKYTLKTESGKDEAQEFRGTFKRYNQEQVKELLSSGKSDSDMVREVLVDWKAQDLETHQDIPYSEAIRDVLLNQPGVGGAIILRYCESVGAVRPKA